MAKRRQPEATDLSLEKADPFRRLPPQDRRAFRLLLQQFEIADDAWDVLLLGDGSGSKWGHAVGFGSVMFDRRNGRHRTWHGALNDGTVNLAEIMAYMAPLTFLATQALDAKEAGMRLKVVNVHIFTDSQYCRDTGKKGCSMQGKNNLLWECLKSVNRVGVIPHWHWIRRETSPLNSLVDRLSKASRHAIMSI